MGMPSQSRERYGLIALVTSVAIFCPGLTALADAVPRFEPAACNLPDVADVAPRLRCGVVRVPRDQAHPDGPTYALAVVVVASATQPVQPDPVVYISGGPGSPLTVHAGYQARHPYAPDRDLILVDQRGMGRSEPRLCPEMQGALVDAMLAVATDPTPEALMGDRAAHAACRDRIRSRGVDLDAFGTAATVADYEWVRRALGVDRWNVVGESYGTTVAMSLLARHAEHIRTAVLDSLNPPDAYFGMPWSARVASARDAFFAARDADRDGTAPPPDLAAAYGKAVERLRGRDVSVPLPPSLQVPGDRARLTPSLFEEVIGRLVYYPPFYDGLPGLVAAVRDGDPAPAAAALTSLLTGAKRDGNDGAFTAVECRDRPRWREPPVAGTSALDLALLPPGVCPGWAAPGPEPEVPRDLGIPTLVLQGQFDPNMRPEQGRHFADAIGSRARWVEFAGVGHNVRHYSRCAQDLVAAFIAAPDRELDATCATRRPDPNLQAPVQP